MTPNERSVFFDICDELRTARRTRRLLQVSVVKLIREKTELEKNVDFWTKFNAAEHAEVNRLRIENIRLREELKAFVRGTGYKYTEGGN
jgi:hypothetical protein